MKFEKVSFEEFKKYFPKVDEEQIKEIHNNLPLPRRMTKNSCGYDFHIPFNLTLRPDQEITVPTGIKISLDNDKKLSIYPRSGLGFKFYVRLANTVGLIDADYYNNEDNEGHILVKLRMEGHSEMKLNQFDRFCQGTIDKYYITEDDDTNEERTGGLGHTDKKE